MYLAIEKKRLVLHGAARFAMVEHRELFRPAKSVIGS
jgi:hypothetical protein